MAKQFNGSPASCGACFGSTVGVREQAIKDYPAALERYVMLSTIQQAPRLCVHTDGDYRVCHRPEAI